MSEDFNYEEGPPSDPLEDLKQEAYREGYEAALGDLRRRIVHEIYVYGEKLPEMDGGNLIYEALDDIMAALYGAYNDLKKMVNS